MNSAWVLCLALDDAHALGALRLAPGLEIASDGVRLWLRGRTSDESLARSLVKLPATARYAWGSDNSLRLVNDRIPSKRLPDLVWKPLHTWLRMERSSAALPGELPRPISLALVRSCEEKSPDLLLTSLREWTTFAAAAAEIRLRGLQFAANEAGEVLILGRPLPPLPGQRFVAHQRIAVPAGFHWEPRVSAQVLRQVFGAVESDLILWHEDGTFS